MTIIDLHAARRSRSGNRAAPPPTSDPIHADQSDSPEASLDRAELLAEMLEDENGPEDGDDLTREEVKADLRSWLRTRDYSYVLAGNRFWLYDPEAGVWQPVERSALCNDNPRLADRRHYALFVEVLREQGRWFDRATYSFHRQPSNVLNQLRFDFLAVAEGSHHWLFDTLVESLGGAKAENVEHIERVVLAKYQNPADYTLPALCLSDDGGTGKSLFVSTVLATIFGPGLVQDNLSIAQATGRFNTALVGKAIVFVNEAVEDKADDNALKQIVGSRTITVEPKGVDPYNADNTPLYIFAGNGVSGCVRLTGTAVDRRYSVITGTSPLEHYIAQHLRIDEDAAKDWLHDEGVAILSDRQHVAYWLGHLVAKHGTVGRVQALHGEDYRRFLRVQTPMHEQVFEAVFLHPDFSHIKMSTLRDLYQALYRQHNGGNGYLRGRKLYEQAQKWLTKHRPDIVKMNVKWGSPRTTADVFIDPLSHSSGPVRNNDDGYIEKDEYGGRTRPAIDLP